MGLTFSQKPILSFIGLRKQVCCCISSINQYFRPKTDTCVISGKPVALLQVTSLEIHWPHSKVFVVAHWHQHVLRWTLYSCFGLVLNCVSANVQLYANKMQPMKEWVLNLVYFWGQLHFVSLNVQLNWNKVSFLEELDYCLLVLMSLACRFHCNL